MKKSIALCAFVLLLQPCSFGSTVPTMWVNDVAQPCATVTAKEAYLRDILSAYASLAKLHAAYCAAAQGAVPHAELVATIKQTTETLRPLCARLSAVSADELKQLVLLADAVIWQADWMASLHCGECKLDLPGNDVCGLELLAGLSGCVIESVQYPLTPQDEYDALSELMSVLKGEAVMTQAAYWLDERWVKDYKTAYYFLKDVTAAFSMEDEAAAVKLLQELTPALEYLLQGGETDRLRMTYLTLAFSNMLRSAAGQGAPVPVEQGDARKAIMADMMKQLPALESLVGLGSTLAEPAAE